ncbi:MAG: diheme cytochrome c [Burkholderiaceae bacterium]
MPRALHSSSRPSWRALLFALLCVSQAAIADGDLRIAPAVVLPQYKTECAACHVAYPPGLLPASTWQHVMGNLPRHYGTDASLDDATVAQLSAWLSANAATNRRFREVPPEDRITRSAWFIRKHDEVPAATWKRPAIKSASNCAACHSGAEQGDFNERNVNIPR